MYTLQAANKRCTGWFTTLSFAYKTDFLIAWHIQKKTSEYDQELSQSQTADQPRHREEESKYTDCHKTSGRPLK